MPSSLTTPPRAPLDPDGMTDEERAAWWEGECRRVSKEETAVRATLAQLLHCPATWKHIIFEVARLA